MPRLRVWFALAGLLLAVQVVAAAYLPARLAAVLPAVNLLVFFLAFTFFTFRTMSANKDSLDGDALLAQGRFLAAVERFARGAKKAPRSSILPLNRGVALMCLWRVAEADAAFAEAAAKRLTGFDLARLLHPQRALAAALLGSPEAAERWLEEAAAAGAGDSAQGTLARAVVAARRGEWAQVRSLLQRYEVKQLGGPSRGLADALSAWAVEQLTGERRHVDRVALLGEAGTDALEELWPELADFVARAPPA